jgi:nitrogenase molybdenum-cofactor synthesis protein NifE
VAISLDKLFEAGCDPEARHKVCRSRGGESCAFDGAAIVLMPIADAAHVIHGPIVCAGNAWEGRGVRSTAGDFHRRGFTTDLTELDIIYGSEDKLAEAVREVVAREHPKAVFVYATCVSGLTGEDIDAVCMSLAAELSLPVVPVNAPGFVGPKNLGNRIAGEVLLEHVIGTAEPPESTPFDIALIGEYNVAGDLDLIEPLLAEAGIRLLSRITGNARFEEIRWAHRAKLSVVSCSRALINVAAGLRRTHGVPYLEVSFFGAAEIARSLRAIADALEAASPEAVGVGERVERVIVTHEAELACTLEAHLPALKGKRAVLYSGGVKSWSIASALRDLGVEILAVGTKKSSAEDEEKVRAVLGEGVRLIENISPAIIRQIMNEEGGQLLVAGGRNRYLAAKEGWPFVDVNQEREAAYAGYEGLVNLAADLANSVRFYERQVREPAVGDALADTPVHVSERHAATDPLKNAPSLGAAVALQGIDGALPVIHGAQGCTFLGKVLAIRHFNEPIALGTTKLFTEDVVLGGDETLRTTVTGLADSAHPSLIAVISSAAAEVKGDDVDATVRELEREVDSAVIAVHAPDYAGGFEEGYLAAVRALVALAGGCDGGPVASRQVTVLAGAHLTPADVREVRDMMEAFGLRPVLVPDVGALDGSREGLSAVASGGTTLGEVRSIAASEHTLVLGASLESAARDLAERFATPYTVLQATCGLAATDQLLAVLTLLSGKTAPPRLERDRRVLVDAMRDAHGRISGRRVALALEPDAALAMAAFFDELAARPHEVVVPTSPPHVRRIAAHRVTVGDLASVPQAIDLLVSNSHAERIAHMRGVPLLEYGFPRAETYGASRQLTVGYRGAAAVVDALANLLASHSHLPARIPDDSPDTTAQPERSMS